MLKNLMTKRYPENRERFLNNKKAQKKNEGIQLTPQQRAQYNLIEISDSDFPQIHHQDKKKAINEFGRYNESVPVIPTTPNKQKKQRSVLQLQKKSKNFFSQQIHRNKPNQFRVSVAERMTQSFRAGMRQSHCEVRTDEVCVLKRKLVLNFSNYLLLDNRETSKEQQQSHRQRKKSYQPKPSINSRTYYKKRWIPLQEQGTEQKDIMDRINANKKLVPLDASYWKIYSKKKQL